MKWGKVLKYTLIPTVIIGIPTFLSTDGFLTWLYEKSIRDKWESAPTVTYDCADYFRMTFRAERAGEVYKVFYDHWPEHDLFPDAVYLRACALRDVAQDLEYAAHGQIEIIEKKLALRQEAMELFDWYAMNYPTLPKATLARTAAQAIRAGY